QYILCLKKSILLDLETTTSNTSQSSNIEINDEKSVNKKFSFGKKNRKYQNWDPNELKISGKTYVKLNNLHFIPTLFKEIFKKLPDQLNTTNKIDDILNVDRMIPTNEKSLPKTPPEPPLKDSLLLETKIPWVGVEKS
ncbi:hypothetical protein HK099_002289, partial [Clydaea vesicula]